MEAGFIYLVTRTLTFESFEPHTSKRLAIEPPSSPFHCGASRHSPPVTPPATAEMPIERQETGLSLRRASQGDPKSRGHAGHAGGTIPYHGNCHCGENRFEVRLPVIATATSCNCSLCRKSGYLWAFPDVASINYTRGDAETLGTFETETLIHKVSFSPCGFWVAA